MKELLTRTISGLVFAAVVIACIFISPWTYAALMLFVVIVGTFEMGRLHHMSDKMDLILGELFTVFSFALAALSVLKVIPQRWLVLELLFLSLPFLYALFSNKKTVKDVFAYIYSSLVFLSLPCSLMLFLACFRERI